MRSHEKFKKSALAKLEYDTTGNDWRNKVRECPYCKEVWVKVAGCEGETTCGNYADLGATETTSEGILGWAWIKIKGAYTYQKV